MPSRNTRKDSYNKLSLENPAMEGNGTCPGCGAASGETVIGVYQDSPLELPMDYCKICKRTRGLDRDDEE